MKRRKVTYAVSRKNPLTWIAALLALCAGIGYVAFATCEKGTGVTGWDVCFRVILPVFAALYLIQTLLLRGQERAYRIAVPFWMLMISLLYACLGLALPWYGVLGLALLLCAAGLAVYHSASGIWRGDWLIVLLSGLAICAIVLVHNRTLHGAFSWEQWLAFLPDGCFFLAFVVTGLALKALPEDGSYRMFWGDRSDGRLVRSLDPITKVGVYLMPTRNGAANKFHGQIEITRLEKFIRQKKLSEMPGIGVTEVLLAAIVRTISQYPAMNRFISGQKIYSRADDIVFCMTIKKEMTTDGSETIIKLHLNPRDTLKEVYEKFHNAVEEVKRTTELDSNFDVTAKLIDMIPGVLLKFVVWLLKTLDYFGLLPKALLEVSPFHGTIFFTSMGSLGIPAIFHHLYDFGNLPVFCAFGCKQRKREIGEDGEVLHKKYIDYTFNIDERTVDGFYYATGVKYFQKLLMKPEQLELPPEEVVPDVP